MRSLENAAKAVAVLLLTPYFLSVMVMTPYYNRQYSRENGFLKWFLLGEIVPTAKALA
jgi:ABC-type polysaccharide transport system permease subunit